MPGWVAEGWREYARRMPPNLNLTLIEVAPGGRRQTAPGPDAEGRALLARVPAGSQRIAVHGGGRAWTTEQLADHLDDWQHQARAVSFLVGGADGHCAEVLDNSDGHWSLGPLTLPHMLVRIIVAEQLYRAQSILAGHPYHRR